MVDERTDELIQMEVDGEISPAEKAELDAALAADGEARKSLESFRFLARELDALQRVEAPPLLASSVARALQARRSDRPSLSPASLRVADRRRRVLYLAYAAAAGLLIGLLAAPFLMRTDAFRNAVEPGSAAASIGAAELSSWEIVDRQSAATARGNVRIAVRRSGEKLAVEAAFMGSAGSEGAISWNPSRASLLAFARDRSPGAPVVEEGRVRIPIDGGGSLTLVLAATQTPGSIHVDIDGTRVLSSDVTLDDTRD